MRVSLSNSYYIMLIKDIDFFVPHVHHILPIKVVHSLVQCCILLLFLGMGPVKGSSDVILGQILSPPLKLLKACVDLEIIYLLPIPGVGKHALVSVALSIPGNLIIPDLHTSLLIISTLHYHPYHQLPHVGCRGLGPAPPPPLLT